MTTEGISGREHSKSKEPVVKKCPGQVQKLMLLLSVSGPLCTQLGLSFPIFVVCKEWSLRVWELYGLEQVILEHRRVIILKMGSILSSSHGWHCGLNKTNHAKFSAWHAAGT